MVLIGQKNYKDFLQLAIASIITFTLLLLPFLWLGGEGFLNMTVYTPLKSAFRPDSYSLTAWFYSQTGKNSRQMGVYATDFGDTAHLHGAIL